MHGPYDALLLVSFGGPEGPDDVMPFLENVTRGRGIPRERLLGVAEHYQHFGGVSPINEQNRALLAALRDELDRQHVELPVYWGNRNWGPYLTDTMAEMADKGHRRVLALVTSAYSSYSGCRQYREDLYAAREPLGDRAPQVDKVRHYFDHPGFIGATARAVVDALEQVPAGSPVAFVTHSVPDAMDEVSGAPFGGHMYVRQHEAVAAIVADRVQAQTGRRIAHELVYCSRSGPPTQPWLEPDVNDHLRALKEAGAPGVVVAPIGFVSDHMEVKFDLDTEAAETAEEIGLPFARAATVGTDPEFVSGLVDLIKERAATESGAAVDRVALSPVGPWPDVCPAGCCANLRAYKPTCCGED
ncbi:ferrochelatase [Motilibacter aurantiacus]|uniref:ferrochelatase n=1 Tax=Motilibacter aurantiacus TaxID=2714955 RepID=UPI002F2B7CFD